MRVIFYTATYLRSEALELARSIGVEHVIAKPVEPAQVLRVVEQVLAEESPLTRFSAPKDFSESHLRLVTSKLLQKVDELGMSDRARRELLSRLVTAQEEERRNIAADIHDDSVQAMFAAGLRIDRLARQLDGQPQARLATEAREVISAAIGRLRHLIFEVRPRTLDGEGLAAAITDHLEVVAEQAGFSGTLKGELADEPPLDHRVVLYRIYQEALHNVRKHSGASNVIVTLQQSSTEWVLEVADDGTGFDLQGVTSHNGHLGLASMAERAEFTGGTLTIDSAPGRGSRIIVSLPRPADADGGQDG